MANLLRAAGAIVLALGAALIGVASLGALLLAAGLVALDGNDIKPVLERRLSGAAGREILIEGDLRLEASLQPLVVLHQLKVADAPWAGRPYMVEVPRLALRFDVPRLLRGDLVLVAIEVERPAVTLERADDGRRNWDFATADEGAGDGGFLPIIERLRIDGGVLTYIDGPQDLRHQLELAGARGSLTGPQRALDFAATGTVDEAAPVRVRLTAEALAPTGGRPRPVHAELELAEARLVADGTIAAGDGAVGRVALDLLAETPDTTTLQPLSPWVLPDWPGFRLEGRAVREGSSLTLRDLAVTVGESDLGGRIALDTGGERPHVSAVLRSRRLDVVQLLGHPARGPGPFIPETPIPFGLLHQFDAELRYEASTVNAPEFTLENLGFGLAVQGGMLRIDPFAFEIGDGRVRSEALRVDARRQPTAVGIHLLVENLGFDALLQEFGVQANAFGRLDGGIDLVGRGQSPAAIFGSADGSIELIMQGGQIDALLTSLAGQDITEVLDALALETDATIPLRCFIADFDAEDGLLTSRTLVLDAASAMIVGAGEIDLDAQRVNLALLPQHKEATPLAAQAPVHINGPFKDIELAVDTGAAVASLITPIELPDADDADCQALAEAARRD